MSGNNNGERRSLREISENYLVVDLERIDLQRRLNELDDKASSLISEAVDTLDEMVKETACVQLGDGQIAVIDKLTDETATIDIYPLEVD